MRLRSSSFEMSDEHHLRAARGCCAASRRTRGQVAGDAADAQVGRGEPRAADLLEQLEQPLAGLEHVEEDGERAQLHGRGAEAGQVVGDARDLADDHADVLRALGDLLGDAHQLLDRHRVADVVEHRRDVVEAIGVGEDLRPGRALRLLLEAAVQVADLDVGARDPLPLDLQHHAHRAVHGGVRRAHVEGNGLGRQIGRGRSSAS